MFGPKRTAAFDPSIIGGEGQTHKKFECLRQNDRKTVGLGTGTKGKGRTDVTEIEYAYCDYCMAFKRIPEMTILYGNEDYPCVRRLCNGHCLSDFLYVRDREKYGRVNVMIFGSRSAGPFEIYRSRGKEVKKVNDYISLSGSIQVAKDAKNLAVLLANRGR
jgi:hypothetical protein